MGKLNGCALYSTDVAALGSWKAVNSALRQFGGGALSKSPRYNNTCGCHVLCYVVSVFST